VLAAQAPRAPERRSFGAAVAEACAALGARVHRCAATDAHAAVDEPAIEGAVASALERGRLDLLAVDAAGMFAEALARGAGAQAALRVCMAATWETTRALLAQTGAAPGARIVYIAPPPDAGELAGGARSGLENLARTLSIEWARHAITTVAVLPGERTSAGEAAALTAYLGSRAGAYFSGCVFDFR
jgi:NAD(P)-dependent dehydrogenase (short-subunit alcohol dehydrogenase family)